MPRFADIDLARLTPAQQKVHDAIVAGPRGKVEGPLRVWLVSPYFAARAQELGAYCRFGTSLPSRLSELAILVTAAHWRAGFEWHHHEKIARAAGISIAAIAAIRAGQEPSFAKEEEAVVYAFSRELLQTRKVSNATYTRAARVLGEIGVVDLVGVLGYYGLISMTINAFEVPVPDGPDPFAGGI